MYYPKSQIKSNLYTNGDEFVFLDSRQPYAGYYFKTSTGQYFTGRTPDDLPNIEITLNSALIRENIPANQSNYSVLINTDLADNSTYNNLINSTPIQISPSYIAPVPTQQDYQNGEFRRYFCKKGNEILYLEIDQTTFDKLVAKDPQYLFSLYEPFNLPWQLTGVKEEVERTNRRIVELTSNRLKLPQLGRYLKDDYLKYYK